MANLGSVRETGFENVSILSGNQAIARAAIEAGVSPVTGYQGTPSTYVITTLKLKETRSYRNEGGVGHR